MSKPNVGTHAIGEVRAAVAAPRRAIVIEASLQNFLTVLRPGSPTISDAEGALAPAFMRALTYCCVAALAPAVGRCAPAPTLTVPGQTLRTNATIVPARRLPLCTGPVSHTSAEHLTLPETSLIDPRFLFEQLKLLSNPQIAALQSILQAAIEARRAISDPLTTDHERVAMLAALAQSIVKESLPTGRDADILPRASQAATALYRSTAILRKSVERNDRLILTEGVHTATASWQDDIELLEEALHLERPMALAHDATRRWLYGAAVSAVLFMAANYHTDVSALIVVAAIALGLFVAWGRIEAITSRRPIHHATRKIRRIARTVALLSFAALAAIGAFASAARDRAVEIGAIPNTKKLAWWGARAVHRLLFAFGAPALPALFVAMNRNTKQ